MRLRLVGSCAKVRPSVRAISSDGRGPATSGSESPLRKSQNIGVWSA